MLPPSRQVDPRQRQIADVHRERLGLEHADWALRLARESGYADERDIRRLEERARRWADKPEALIRREMENAVARRLTAKRSVA